MKIYLGILFAFFYQDRLYANACSFFSKTRGIILFISIFFITFIACKTSSPFVEQKIKGETNLFSNYDKYSLLNSHSTVGRIDSAIANLNKLAKSDNQIFIHTNLAQLYMLKSNLDLAETHARKALQINVDNYDARIVLAGVYFRREMFDLAQMVLESLPSDKNSEVLNLFGLIAMGKDEKSKASYYFKEALKVDPNDIAVRMNLGILYLKYRRINEAGIQFERVLAVTPDNNDAKLHMATIYMARKQFNLAQKSYQEIRDDHESNPILLYNYAIALSEQGRYKNAIDVLKEYIALISKDRSNTSVDIANADSLMETFRIHLASENGGMSVEEIESLAAKIRKREKKSKQIPLQVYPQNLQRRITTGTVVNGINPKNSESSHLGKRKNLRSAENVDIKNKNRKDANVDGEIKELEKILTQ